MHNLFRFLFYKLLVRFNVIITIKRTIKIIKMQNEYFFDKASPRSNIVLPYE